MMFVLDDVLMNDLKTREASGSKLLLLRETGESSGSFNSRVCSTERQ